MCYCSAVQWQLSMSCCIKRNYFIFKALSYINKTQKYHYSKRTVDLHEFKLTQFFSLLTVHQNLRDIKKNNQRYFNSLHMLICCKYYDGYWVHTLQYTCLLSWNLVLSSFPGLSYCIQSLSESSRVFAKIAQNVTNIC